MKRNEAIHLIEKLIVENPLDIDGFQIMDFIENRIGMLPPKTVKESVIHQVREIEGTNLTVGTRFEIKEVNEWDDE